MKVSEYTRQGELVNVNNKEIRCHRIDNDINGNPRYVVHFLDLGIELKDYGKIPGLKRYTGKWFGGGYVFQSYNIEQDLQYALQKVERFYRRNVK